MPCASGSTMAMTQAFTAGPIFSSWARRRTGSGPSIRRRRALRVAYRSTSSPLEGEEKSLNLRQSRHAAKEQGRGEAGHLFRIGARLDLAAQFEGDAGHG